MTGLDNLLAGYRRFRKGAYTDQKSRYDELVHGQAPKVMVISCSDSRVDPSIVFDAGPGEIFAVRNIANLVPPFEVGGGRHGVSAALEFAVTQINVPEIVVMGHGRCGGCQAALTRRFDGAAAGEGHFIAHWIELLNDARDRILAAHDGRADGDAERALELAAVDVSLDNLRTFPFVREREAEGSLRLSGAYFAISEGVLYLRGADGQFLPAD